MIRQTSNEETENTDFQAEIQYKFLLSSWKKVWFIICRQRHMGKVGGTFLQKDTRFKLC
jgi:hypothetical protein